METSLSANTATANSNSESRQLDAVIVGAGFAGMHMLKQLRDLGLNAKAIEAGENVGGTWYWNRYPGARCDVHSIEYSYSWSKELQQDWTWSEKYSPQPEILKYANHVADRFDLRKDIEFNTRVKSAHFDEANGRWDVTTDKGERISSKYCVMATGCLSSYNIPKIKGLETFKGKMFHTSDWPREGVDFTGKRVGIIGTGSSGIQSIPVIAEQAGHLYVFQRTPNFTVPARNRKLEEEEIKSVKEKYPEIRERAKNNLFGWDSISVNPNPLSKYTHEEQQELMEKSWERGGIEFVGTFADIFTCKESNDIVASFVHNKIRETVKDQRVAELLCPKDHPIGTKRICVDTNYWATYNRENVTLVDVKSSPISEITPEGLRTADELYELDYLILATGFDAMTGSLTKIDIRGRDGLSLKEKWAEGPKTYLGLMTSKVPNLFIITGPQSPSVLSNMPTSIEQNVEWITECISHLRKNDISTMEAAEAAESAWVDHVNFVANFTLYPQANSWYLGANIPGKPRIFMPYAAGVGPYRSKCTEVAKNGYEGFILKN